MTDAQFEKIKRSLIFHSENGIENLCTLTETALRTIIEDAVKFYEKQQKIDAEQIRALQKQNGELTDEVKELEEKLIEADNATDVFNAQEKRIAELEAQIEKMKCCGNCKHRDDMTSYCKKHKKEIYIFMVDSKCNDWKLFD